ncbi:hypothetical protein CAPTEDRAFT_226355 [Capitella teleta]|uniref:39S ribosomal protein L41, mitochondrial n=1 Tax=Capitella teleta TaxID=283909 RepID=R7V7G7_CAPTE|nr:hypothetical protein CAPTEDRAFT_226355 [Capitella teleta]|eukprot:ELU11675.1 hypothetical protein CAPTEDRAFT_226355 [Capitella teleta]
MSLFKCHFLNAKVLHTGAIPLRCFSVSSPLLYERRKRPLGPVTARERRHLPFDRKWPINPKDVSPIKEGGKIEICKELGLRIGDMPRAPGWFDKEGGFHFDEDMVPDFVVPDLTNFKLKPYVSYNVEEINQSEFTAKNLFDECYAKKLVEDFQEGKIDATTVEEKKEELLQTPAVNK